jgi:hypothetical protein
MLYLGIDQHRKQLTVSVRDEGGDVVLRRQVSTEEVKEEVKGSGVFLLAYLATKDSRPLVCGPL